jgi:hypothetical protein
MRLPSATSQEKAMPARPALGPSRFRHVVSSLGALALLASCTALSCSGDGDGISFTWHDADCDGVEDGVDAVLDDMDADGQGDRCDNCPTLANGPNGGPDNQRDSDGDDVGNACDADDDNDGVLDAADNCPLVANPTQAGTDTDVDGVPDACDNCAMLANAGQADSDVSLGRAAPDGRGDACDNCPAVPNVNSGNVDCNGDGDVADPGEAAGAQCDRDGDGVGDACDPA